MASNTKYTVVAINDDTDTCECCGRSNLKRVVWLRNSEGFETAFGTTCASRAMGMQATTKAQSERKMYALLEEENRRAWNAMSPEERNAARMAAAKRVKRF